MWFRRSSGNSAIDWKPLTTEKQFLELLDQEKTVVIFKHSTRCSLSSVAMNRLEREYGGGEAEFYYLDVIQYRPVSDRIARELGIVHESPQVIVLKKGRVIHSASHNAISGAAIPA